MEQLLRWAVLDTEKDNFLLSQDLGAVPCVVGTMTPSLSGTLEQICGDAKMQRKIPKHLGEQM